MDENKIIKHILQFEKEGIGNVRTVVDADQNLWFLLNDLGKCLNILNPSDRINKLVQNHFLNTSDKLAVTYASCKEEGRLDFWEKIKGGQNDTSNKVFVSEYAMYALVMRSDKPVGRSFNKWITHEVLPSIGKNGGYVYGQENLSKEDKAVITESIKDLSKTVDSLLTKNKKLSGYLVETDAAYEKALEENTKLYLELDSLKERVSERYKNYVPKTEPVEVSHKEPDGYFDTRSGILYFGKKTYNEEPDYDWDGFLR